MRNAPRRKYRRAILRERGGCPSELRILTPNGRFLAFRCVRYLPPHEIHRAVTRGGPLDVMLFPRSTMITWGAPGGGRP